MLPPSARFCPYCAWPLETKEIDHKRRSYCPRCGYVHYEQLKVGAGAIIEQSGRLLLMRRTSQPFAGRWNLPAGYVEIDESPLQAAAREVFEETGLQVEATRLDNVYFADDDPRGNTLLVVYSCRVIGGALHETPEGRHPTFFSRTEIPTDLSGGGHDQAILAWKNRSDDH
jgi:8-oxo-dGTP diphosphatase